jgi:pilus assembly protein Flp/PilA
MAPHEVAAETGSQDGLVPAASGRRVTGPAEVPFLTLIHRSCSMRSLFQKFWQEEEGAAAIEYALIAALIALAIVGGAGLLGTELGNSFTALQEALNAART